MTSDFLNSIFTVYRTATIIVSIVWAVLVIVARWKIFVKAGQPGWASIIPFYCTFKLCEITVDNGWKMFLMLIPGFGQFYAIYVSCFKLSEVFGHGIGYTVGLFFLTPIFLMLIAFGPSQYMNGNYEIVLPEKSMAILHVVAGIVMLLLGPVIGLFLSGPIQLLGWVLCLIGFVFTFLGICGVVKVQGDEKKYNLSAG